MQSPPFPPTSSLLGPNILLNTIFSNTLSFLSSLNVSDQVSHPYKTKDKIIFLYILIFKFLDFPHTSHNYHRHHQVYVRKGTTRGQCEEHVLTNKEDVRTSNMFDLSFAFSIQLHFTQNSSRTYTQVNKFLISCQGSGLRDVKRGAANDAARSNTYYLSLHLFALFICFILHVAHWQLTL